VGSCYTYTVEIAGRELVIHADKIVPQFRSAMALVLGIDAAWTAGGSSCLALMRIASDARRVVAVAPSYDSFVVHAESEKPVAWLRPTSGVPDIARILRAARKIGGGTVDVVAIDMPMSLGIIDGRRTADDAIARTGIGTHSPTKRPGAFGKAISDAFFAEGFSLATTSLPIKSPALIEVFPLAALMRLMRLRTRPPYKVAKTSKYWPGRTREERQLLLKQEWARIFAALRTEIRELGFSFPTDWSCWAALKPYEDGLDAVISAWVGTKFLDRTAEPFGDLSAAIWVPKL
jgi:predicted RNase H-like nuclease